MLKKVGREGWKNWRCIRAAGQTGRRWIRRKRSKQSCNSPRSTEESMLLPGNKSNDDIHLIFGPTHADVLLQKRQHPSVFFFWDKVVFVKLLLKVSSIFQINQWTTSRTTRKISSTSNNYLSDVKIIRWFEKKIILENQSFFLIFETAIKCNLIFSANNFLLCTFKLIIAIFPTIWRFILKLCLCLHFR